MLPSFKRYNPVVANYLGWRTTWRVLPSSWAKYRQAVMLLKFTTEDSALVRFEGWPFSALQNTHVTIWAIAQLPHANFKKENQTPYILEWYNANPFFCCQGKVNTLDTPVVLTGLDLWTRSMVQGCSPSQDGAPHMLNLVFRITPTGLPKKIHGEPYRPNEWWKLHLAHGLEVKHPWARQMKLYSAHRTGIYGHQELSNGSKLRFLWVHLHLTAELTN